MSISTFADEFDMDYNAGAYKMSSRDRNTLDRNCKRFRDKPRIYSKYIKSPTSSDESDSNNVNKVKHSLNSSKYIGNIEQFEKSVNAYQKCPVGDSFGYLEERDDCGSSSYSPRHQKKRQHPKNRPLSSNRINQDPLFQCKDNVKCSIDSHRESEIRYFQNSSHLPLPKTTPTKSSPWIGFENSSSDSIWQLKKMNEQDSKMLATLRPRENYHQRNPKQKRRGFNNYGDTGVDVTTDARVLFDAVRHGKNHLVRFILDASSVDIVNSRDLHGKTPLMACCYTKEEGARDNTVRLLLRHGADVNATDDCGRTALSYVCERRCNDILRILIKEHNVDPDITDTNGNTPLIYSAMVGNDIACDILIRHFRRLGLNIEARNDEGFTALLMAAKHGNITCAQILVGQGKASSELRDSKYGLSVEEWLAKKGFTLQDIKPVRQDGKGRSRFVKLANIAAICTAPKKHIQAAPPYGEIDYHLNHFQLGKIDDDDSYYSDATTGTDLSNENFSQYLARYSDRYNDLELDFAQKHYRIYPYRQNVRPKLKTSSTQTQTEDDDNEGEVNVRDDDIEEERMTDITVPETARSETGTEVMIIQNDKKVHNEKKCNRTNTDGNPKITRSSEKTKDRGTKETKRLSLPEIQHTPMVSRGDTASTERKSSLDVLPEKLIASIELGDGRKQSIELHPDSLRHKVYWSPVDDDRLDDDRKNLLPLEFERPRSSVSDSETSMTEDGPIF